MDNPKVTVLMSVYNGEKYLGEAIDSIVQQTFTDFEFIIINDGSTDGTIQILKSYNDPRIVVINQFNAGLTKSLNKGIDLARGKYIARMDSDDISLPERLKKQVDFMETNAEVGVCGTWVSAFKPDCSVVWRYPVEPEIIRSFLLFWVPLAHPSVIFRRSLLVEKKLFYSEEFIYAQDYEFWHRCAENSPLANLPEVLLKYRLSSESVSSKSNKQQRDFTRKIHEKYIGNLGIIPDSYDMELHNRIFSWSFDDLNAKTVDDLNEWLVKLDKANETTSTYNKVSFKKVLGFWWLQICSENNKAGFSPYQTFQNSPLRNYVKSLDKLKFTIRQCLKIFKLK